MNFSGIDLHSNNSVVVVSDEDDRIVYQKRLPNNLEQIRAALAPYRDELAGVVVESTYYRRPRIMHGFPMEQSASDDMNFRRNQVACGLRRNKYPCSAYFTRNLNRA
jgi:hypothetical protein